MPPSVQFDEEPNYRYSNTRSVLKKSGNSLLSLVKQTGLVTSDEGAVRALAAVAVFAVVVSIYLFVRTTNVPEGGRHPVPLGSPRMIQTK
ncbi:MAG: hypothetical protein ABIT47_01480 [Candidatus Paceibacterota bacterium]